MNQAAERTDVEFDSGCDRCAAWLYRPAEAREPTPAVVLAPGLAGVRAAAVDGFAAHFAAAGMAALVVDYRGFGDSGGSPRQLMTVHRQLEDWHAPSRPPARCPASTCAGCAVGGSITGGHVLRVAVEDHSIAAVVSHVPLVDGLSSTAAGPMLLTLASRDAVSPPRRAERLVRRAPHVEVASYAGALRVVRGTRR